MIDKNGYRLNVGMILINNQNLVFWGKRKGEDSWQFPQGGLHENETIEDGMFRELKEELGLPKEHVQIIHHTQDWLYYDVPAIYNRPNNHGYKGQKQIWYLLLLTGKDHHINVKSHVEQEFDAWRWIDYWTTAESVISFKRNVYQAALNELSNYLPKI